ncbi:MAG TPA: hypothetical protein VKY85_01170 [Candidatus Angelobacter sp.]|nr:hypothetical protein [Candidatus Angelobacter sp.]
MREILRERNGRRGRFLATFGRFGEKKGFKGYPIRTALFQNIRDEVGTVVADHLWFRVGKRLDELKLEPGDEIEFFARVAPYKKGYRGRRDDFDLPPPSIDYGLRFPTHVRKVKPPREFVDDVEREPIPPMDQAEQMGLF